MRLNALPLYQPVLRWVLLLALALAPAWASSAQPGTEPTPIEPAEPKEAEEPAGPMSIELDLNRLIFENTSTAQQDKVWQLTAQPGRQIAYIPFRVSNVNRLNSLSRFPISVRTGRFIGFAIPAPNKDGAQPNHLNFDQIIRADADSFGQLLFPQKEDDPSNDAPADERDEKLKEVPENAPRLAREIKLHPDGTVQWAMDRSFHGATLTAASETNLYPYKLDSALLREKQPERAERLARQEGEDSRAFALRKREQQLAEREKQTAYRELRDSLRNLPEQFREPAPPVLYAVIEVPAGDSLALLGSSPFPWTLDEKNKQPFLTLAQGGASLETADGQEAYATIGRLADAHALDARAAAIAATRGSLTGKIKTDDPGYKLLTKLLASKDETTRRIALYGVARTTPPTLASAQLLGVAAQTAMGEERKVLSFNSLGKMFQTQSTESDNTAALIEQVNLVIADPDGPGSTRVIEQVLQSIGSRTGSVPMDDKSLQVMIDRIDFSKVPEQDAHGVAAAVIRHAPTNPVAAGWLDHHYLRSKDAARIDVALDQLAQFDPTPEEPAEEGAFVDSQYKTIALDSAEHGLLALLSDADAQHSAKAWAALGRFHVAVKKGDAPPAADPTQAQPVDPSLAVFESVVAAALALDPTPPSLVSFLERQREQSIRQVAPQRMIGLLVAAEGEAMRAAAASVIANPESYNQVLTGLDSTDKLRIVTMLYRAKDQEPPLMAGLIAGGTGSSWFTNFMKEKGELPVRADWAEQFASGGDGQLLGSASSDDTVVASAAAAALVVGAGGTVQQEQSFAQKIVLLEARTSDLVSQAWADYKKKIQAGIYENAQGTYRLSVTIAKKAKPAVGLPGVELQPAPEADPPKRIELGLVDLRAEGTKLSLSVEAVTLSPSPDRLAIRIDKPASLRTFNKPELAKLQLDNLGQSLELLPQEEGVWSGEVLLPDGQTLGVILTPAG